MIEFDFNRFNSIRRCIEKSSESDVCKYNALLAIYDVQKYVESLQKSLKSANSDSDYYSRKYYRSKFFKY